MAGQIGDGNPQELKATLEEYEVKNAANGPDNCDNDEETPGQNGKLGLSLQPLTRMPPNSLAWNLDPKVWW